jgi:hypothetical protein
MRHDHVRNGVSPVDGCEMCELLVKQVKSDEAKEPSGRMPPWLWEKDKDDE